MKGAFTMKFSFSFLKVLQSDKLSGDDQIFQVCPYLNLLIMIKLPFFSARTSPNFSHLLLQVKHEQSPINFSLERDPKNIFCCQCELENYTG